MAEIIWRNGATNEHQFTEVNGVEYRLEKHRIRSRNPRYNHDWRIYKANEDSEPIVGASSQKLAKQYFKTWLEKGG